jgi:hypothetical protein
MSSLANGIGSFIEGTSRGALIRRQMDREDLEDRLAERKLKLYEDREARAARLDEFNLRQKQADFDYTQKEREANEPILSGQRRLKLDEINDTARMRSILDAVKKDYEARKARSIIIDKDETGASTYTVDGLKAASADDAEKMFTQKQGTLLDAYRKKMIPVVTQEYLRRGDVKSADAFQKWSEQKDVENALRDYSGMMTAFELGDVDRAVQHLNSMMANGGYISQDHNEVKAEPIKGEDGKLNGYRINWKNKATGSVISREFTNLAAIMHCLSALSENPAHFSGAEL